MATPLPNRALPRFTRANYGTILPQEFVPETNIGLEAISTFSALRAKKLEEEKKNLTEAGKKEQNEITWLLNFKRTNQDKIDKNLSKLGPNNTQLRNYISNDLLDKEAYYSMLANKETSDGKLRLEYQRLADQYGNRIQNTLDLIPNVSTALANFKNDYEKNINTINSEGGTATLGISELERKTVDALTAQAGMGNNVSEEIFYNEKSGGMAVRVNSDEIRLKYGPQGIVLNNKDYKQFLPSKVPNDTAELENDLQKIKMFVNGKLNKERYFTKSITKDGRTIEKYNEIAIIKDLEETSSAIAISRLGSNNAQISYQNTLLPSIGDQKIDFDKLINAVSDPEFKKQLKKIQAKGETYKEALPFLTDGEGNIGGNTYDIVSQTLYTQAFTDFAAKKFKIIPATEISAPKELSDVDVRAIKKQKDFNDAVKSWEDKFIRTMGEFEGAFNPEGGVMTGELNIFNEIIDEDGKPAQELRPEFIQALSFLNGMTIKSVNKDEVKISGGGLKDDFTVIQGQPISIFVENLHSRIFGENTSLYDSKSAEKFAYQFKPVLPSRDE